MKKRMSLTTKKLFIPIGLSIAAFIFFAIQSDTYATAANISTILREMATPLLVSCGMCFVMAAGYIDLSVGAMAAFICMAASRMIDVGIPVSLILALMVIIGTGCGFVNGFLIRTFHLHPFVGTLAMMSVYRGLTWIISYRNANGSAYAVQITDRAVQNLNRAVSLGSVKLYYSLITAIVCMVICQIVFMKTKFGSNIYAMGANQRAAELTGIKVGAVEGYAYMCCGALTGVCAIFLLARSQCATTTMGTGLEFDAISALVVGGASAMGASETAGKANPVGAAFGALFLYMVYNGIYKLGLPTAFQQIIQGGALILMMMVDSIVTMIRLRNQEIRYGMEQEKIMRGDVSDG